MPNWCDNTLTITGDMNSISLFRNRMQRQHEGEPTLSFNDFVPRPPEEEANWYDWNCEHWGCKWDLHPPDTLITYDQTELTFVFRTAWSPPVAWVATVSGMFPSLRFSLEFDEAGMDFSGVRVFENEEVVESSDGHSAFNMNGDEDAANLK